MRKFKSLQKYGGRKALIITLLIPLFIYSAVCTYPYMQSSLQQVTILSTKAITLNNQDNVSKEVNFEIKNEPQYDVNEKKSVESETVQVVTDTVTSNVVSQVTSLPPKPVDYKVIRESFSNITKIPLKNGYLKNATKISDDTIKDVITKLPKFKIEKNKKPQVLIMHTHATESYQAVASNKYDPSYTARTTDQTKNMIRVGNEIEAELKAHSIGVIHDTTMHDYPSYNGSYERSAATVKKILKKNPSIKIVLDIHRDAIQANETTIMAPIATIDGKTSAQVMIIAGADNGKMNMPNYKENLKLAALLQNTMEEKFEGLTRPILFDYRKYNQDLTTGSILIEIGGHGNSLDEAVYAGKLVGASLASSLEKILEK